MRLAARRVYANQKKRVATLTEGQCLLRRIVVRGFKIIAVNKAKVSRKPCA
jgi:hypothetical protein